MNSTNTRRTLSLALTALALAALAVPASGASKFDKRIERQMRKAGVPGLATAIVVDGETAWTGAYGWADIKNSVPVTPDTIFKIGSISKTVTATAVMQLVDDGLLDLDADVNTYLPFPVRNPHFPESPITARQLLTHTSSISDQLAHELAELMHSDGDYPLPLGEVLGLYLLEGSEFFDPDASFHAWAPGAAPDYSNIGFGLLGYLVEQVSGKSLETFNQERLFGPLEMTESSWFYANLDPDHIAVPYRVKGKNRYQALPFGSFATYPSGLLQTSVRQFASYVKMHLESGRFNGERVLERSSAREMRRVQFPEIAPIQGLAFLVEDTPVGHLVSHNGEFGGYSADLFMIPELGIGIAIFTNCDLYNQFKPRRLAAMAKIHAALFERAFELAELDR